MSISLDAELIGAKELSKALQLLGKSVGGKVLRQAVGAAVNPVVKELRQKAPKGSRAHKTYTGRLVAPGYLSRSIKKKTFKSKSGLYASVKIGVASEAFYGVQFAEKSASNPVHSYKATKRRRAFTRVMPQADWFESTFEGNKKQVTNRFKQELEKKILRAAKKR